MSVYVHVPGIYQFSVPESMKAGTPVGRIKAVDKDLGKNAEMFYNVVGGDDLDMFDVITDKDSQEGIITVVKVTSITSVNYIYCIVTHNYSACFVDLRSSDPQKLYYCICYCMISTYFKT